MRLRAPALSIAVVLLAACSGPHDGTATGTTKSAIVGGSPSTTDDDSVVLILTHVASKDTPQGQYFLNCTGTLLAPNLVLTARHCVSATSDGAFMCNVDGTVQSGTGGAVMEDLPIAESHVFVGLKRPYALDPTTFPGKPSAFVHDASTVLCNADVALMVLAKPIAGATIAPIRLDGPVTKGEALTVVGWGATETEFIPSSRLRRTGVSAVNVGPDTTPFIGGELGAKEFIASESVCTGDSGGPAFDATTHAVVGVVSRGPNGGVTSNGSGCVGTQHVFMQTAPFKDLVLKAFMQAGAEPWLEGQPGPSAPTTEPTADAAAPATDDAGTDPAAPPAAMTSSGCVMAAARGRPASSPAMNAIGLALAIGAVARALAGRPRT